MYKLANDIKEEERVKLRTISRQHRVSEDRVFATYTALIRQGKTEEAARQIMIASLEGKSPCDRISVNSYS